MVPLAIVYTAWSTSEYLNQKLNYLNILHGFVIKIKYITIERTLCEKAITFFFLALIVFWCILQGFSSNVGGFQRITLSLFRDF